MTIIKTLTKIRMILFRDTFIDNASWYFFKKAINDANIKEIKYPIEIDLNNIDIDQRIKIVCLSSDKGISNELITFRFREPTHCKYYYQWINQTDNILDIGSNIGYFPLIANHCNKIICIEPQNQLIPILKQNLILNNIINKARIYNCAIGRNEEMLVLERNKKSNLAHIIAKKSNNKSLNHIEIKAYPLEYFVDSFNINTIRMDVEGYEYNILFERIPHKINKIDMELHIEYIKKDNILQLMKYLENEHFYIQYLIEDFPIRLYPFYSILRKLQLHKRLINIYHNISPTDCIKLLFYGRTIKYLLLKRK